jgi:hypothetical protein
MIPFISALDLGAYLEQTLDDSDLLVEIALDAGCQMVRDDIGQRINLERSQLERHDGTGKESVILRELPVVEVLQVLEDDVELVEGDDYVVVGGRVGILYRKGETWSWSWRWGTHRWSFGRQNVEVVYDSGYAVAEGDVVEAGSGDDPVVDRVPSSIRLVALSAAARVFRAPTLQAVASGITGENMGPYSYTSNPAVAQTIAAGLLEDEKTSLNRYRVGNGP